MAIVIGSAIGYFVTDSSDAKLFFACRFAAPLDFHAPADAHDIRAILVASPSTSPGIGPVMDDGLKNDLDGFVYANPGMKMHLYVNAYTPVPGSVLADFTEASWTSYAAQTLSIWDAAAIISTNVAAKRSTPATFLAT